MKRLQKLEKKIQDKVVAGGGTVTIAGDDDSDDEPAASTKKGKDGKAKKPKKVKDPNEPKKPKSAYIFYVEEHQPSVKAANPDSKPNEIFALLGSKWKALDDSKRKVMVAFQFVASLRYHTSVHNFIVFSLLFIHRNTTI